MFVLQRFVFCPRDLIRTIYISTSLGVWMNLKRKKKRQSSNAMPRVTVEKIMTSVDCGHEGKINQINKRRPMFRVFVLENNKNQGTVVEEVGEIGSSEAISHLKRGASVLLVPRRQKLKDTVVREASVEPWYFTHF